MAMKKPQTPQELPKPHLTIPRSEATDKLSDRISLGKKIHDTDVQSEVELDTLKSERKIWHDYNKDLLSTIFSNERIAKEYESNSHGAIFMGGTRSLSEEIGDFRESMQYKLNSLQSVVGRLELFPEPVPTEAKQSHPNSSILAEGSESNIFIVHGHDNELKEQTARLISDLGLKPIILHEQENKGQTLIEKLESNANKSSFAIILLTPDDFGYSKKDGVEKARPRARQNVVLELGFFIAKLGRSRTCALYKGVDAPTDFDGVVYTLADEAQAWRYTVAKELKVAGYKIDMNKL
jgi:predicted nucleotide-binding protein